MGSFVSRKLRSNIVEVRSHLGKAGGKVLADVGEVVATTEGFDERDHFVEIVPRSRGEEVVFDLIVETTPNPIGDEAVSHVARGEKLDGDKVGDGIVVGDLFHGMMVKEDDESNTEATNHVGDEEKCNGGEDGRHEGKDAQLPDPETDNGSFGEGVRFAVSRIWGRRHCRKE